MKVKIKKMLPDAVIPTYAKEGDAGMDLTAMEIKWVNDSQICYDTGIAVEIPKGYVGLVFPRSSIYKTSLLLTNAVGVIDSGYRGSIQAVFRREDGNVYYVGDRIAQLIILPYPHIEFEEVDELSDSVRGVDGFGSTNK